MTKTYFFCGIGGSGMMPLAFMMKNLGHNVAGSDRSYDQGASLDKFEKIKAHGIDLFPQDGSGVTPNSDVLVVSAAIEDRIPDVAAAKKQNIEIKARAEILSELFNTAPFSIGIAGTSGKSTTTGMVNTIFTHSGVNVSVMNGGVQKDVATQNSVSPDVFISEIDESDGSIQLYTPNIAVLTNMSHDHKPLEEIATLFEDYMARAKDMCVINLDDKNLAALNWPENVVTFSRINPKADIYATDIVQGQNAIQFRVKDTLIHLNVPGLHNVENALAALAVAHAKGMDMNKAASALKNFSGIGRRMEVIGTVSGITVIDDFAHNPDKIAATLSALKNFEGRLIVMFQPHGFAPLRQMGSEIIDSFATYFDMQDILLMPEVYYAGGTVDRSVTSKDIVSLAQSKKVDAHWFEDRASVSEFILNAAKSGDRIVIMGARDDTLTQFGKEILEAL